jgi:hypothetical protein
MDGLPDAERMERLDAEAQRTYGMRFRLLWPKRRKEVWETCESNLRAEPVPTPPLMMAGWPGDTE